MKVFDLNLLPGLIKSKPFLGISEIPEPFRQDVLKFIIGETIHLTEKGEIRIGNNLYKRWIDKITHQGFYSEIDLKLNER